MILSRMITRLPLRILLPAVIGLGVAAALARAVETAEDPVAVLRRHVARFNALEDEPVVNLVSNSAATAWLAANIPLLECPDPEVEEIYYFRWWALRKHLRRPPDGRGGAAPSGHVFTEFINRAEPVSSALGHHLMEGRWLRDPRCHDDYVLWWLRGSAGGPQPRLHRYSQWLADAVVQRTRVTGDRAFAIGLIDDLVADHRQWDAEQRRPDGLYWQFDVRDAMEESISGSRTRRHVRPLLNSYMYGNARALAALARIAERPALASHFDGEADRLRRLVVAALWNERSGFFEVRRDDGALSGVREAIGFIPWYFSLPEPGRGHERAWAQLRDESGFRAPYGLTTAERRHPEFRTRGTGTCEWDGAVWPFATSQTLTALGNVLRDYPQDVVDRRDYRDAFLSYVRSQRMNGRTYIGEYLCERTGAWLKGDHPRSRWYNHSTFADLVIAGLAGLRPREDDVVEVHPLLPDGAWDWFRVTAVKYHGRELEIVWDRDGRRFGRGRGLRVLVEGVMVAQAPGLQRVTGLMPAR